MYGASTPVLAFPLLGEEPIDVDYPVENGSLEAPTMLQETFSTSTLISETFGNQTALMERISLCESGDRQFLDGKPLMSETRDFGYYQISEEYNGELADSLGLDYKNSFIDNLKMAKIILDRQGIGAWVCARL